MTDASSVRALLRAATSATVRAAVGPVPDAELRDVSAVLAHAVGGDPEAALARAETVIRSSANARVYVDGRLGAAACLTIDPRSRQGVVELIATAPGLGGRGLGRACLESAWTGLSLTGLVAETDSDAVGFYRRCGFEITSLGEPYPDVERFRCVLDARDARPGRRADPH